MNGSTPEQAVLKVSNIRGFLATLQAIKPSNPKQGWPLCLATLFYPVTMFVLSTGLLGSPLA